MMILIIIPGTMVIMAVIGISREIKRHTIPVLVWRWISGHTFDGKHRTDAGWFTRGTKVFHVTGRVHRWHHMPRIHRAGIRTGSTVTAAGLAFGLFAARRITLMATEITGAVAVAIMGFLVVRAMRAWQNDRVIVSPLAAGLSGILGIAPAETQRSITLSPSFLTAKEGEIGRVILPPEFRASPDQQGAVEHLITNRLPVDVDFRWHTSRNPQTVKLLASPQPPTMVLFGEYVSLMESCPPGKIFLGLDRKHEPFYGSFNIDDPHWLASCGTGRGKSTWLQSIAAQVLHNDPKASLDGIDPKGNSLTPLTGVPGVDIACDPLNVPEMWDRIMGVKTEMMARLDILKTDPTAEFPIKLLFIDEGNAFANQSKNYWLSPESPREKNDPATPPIWRELGPILWMGRAANVHVIFVGQRVDERATGGIGLRDSMGFRAISGFRPNQYKMLIGDSVAPKSQKPKGRWLYSDGLTETWVQNVIADPKDLDHNAAIIRDYAMAGRHHAAPSGAPPLSPAPAVTLVGKVISPGRAA